VAPEKVISKGMIWLEHQRTTFSLNPPRTLVMTRM
jgi:hypothetical protein